MAEARLDDWENIVSAHINGAPQPVMMDAVRDAAITFCRDSRIDRRWVRTLPYDAARPDTLIPDGDDGAFPGTVIEVWSRCGQVHARTMVDIRSRYPDGYMRELADTPRDIWGWISLRPGQITLVPTPRYSLPDEFAIVAAYQPKRNAVSVPHFLYEMYAHEIGWGALAILHAHDQAPYATPSKAGGFMTMFRESIMLAAHRGDGGFGKQRLRTVGERVARR
ncbi:MAG: hypothetical protein AB7G13_31930 [Lautropia sp.]